MGARDRAAHSADTPSWWARRRASVRAATDFTDATAAFTRPVRRATMVAAATTIPATVFVAREVAGQAAYLSTMGTMAGLLAWPALGFSVLAARRAHPAGEAVFWRRWTVAVGSLVATGVGLALVAGHDTLGLRALSPVAVAVNTVLFMVCNITMMRRRSGGRSVTLDAVETAIATTVAVSALVLLIGDRLLTSPAPWFTNACAGALIGCIIGLVWVSVLFHRTPRHNRRLELLGIFLGVTAVLDASMQLAQGLSGFTLPAAGPLVAHQLTMLALLLVPLHASRVTVPGLERFTPQQQVRTSPAPTILTVAAIPVLVALAVARRGQLPWAVDALAVDASLLAVLLALRALLALNETTHLYRQVAVAAEERRRLLAALTSALDGDRQRIAAQLHEQAVTSYTTFATYLQSASRLSPPGAPLPRTSEHVRAHLNRTAERWREFMLAVRAPRPPTPAPATNLRTAILAHLVAGAGGADGGAEPAIEVDVDSRLHLDWATEALLVRFVQEAVAHAHEDRRVMRLAIAVTGREEGVELLVTATGAERAPGDVVAATAGAADGSVMTHRSDLPGELASFAALAGAELRVERDPAELVLVVRLRRFGTTGDRAPYLRVVPRSPEG